MPRVPACSCRGRARTELGVRSQGLRGVRVHAFCIRKPLTFAYSKRRRCSQAWGQLCSSSFPVCVSVTSALSFTRTSSGCCCSFSQTLAQAVPACTADLNVAFVKKGKKPNKKDVALETVAWQRKCGTCAGWDGHPVAGWRGRRRGRRC